MKLRNKLSYIALGGLLMLIGMLASSVFMPNLFADRDKFGDIECTGLRVVNDRGEMVVELRSGFRGGLVQAFSGGAYSPGPNLVAGLGIDVDGRCFLAAGINKDARNTNAVPYREREGSRQAGGVWLLGNHIEGGKLWMAYPGSKDVDLPCRTYIAATETGARISLTNNAEPYRKGPRKAGDGSFFPYNFDDNLTLRPDNSNYYHTRRLIR